VKFTPLVTPITPLDWLVFVELPVEEIGTAL